MNKTDAYKSYGDSGVNLDRGEKCSRIAYAASQSTFSNQTFDLLEPEKLEDGFAGPLKVKLDLRGGSIVKNSDGVGSKALVAQRTGRHDTLGYDLVAMLADDTVSTGAVPVAGTNTIDLARAEPDLVKGLMDGLVKACEVANISMVGGEIAELPDQVKGYSNPYIWNGDLFGILGKGRRIDGSRIKPGHSIVGVGSRGIRSNGLTLAREICRCSFGEDWHEEPFDDESSWGEVLLRPSRICARALVEMFGGYRGAPKAELSGIVHVTGGGLTNITRVLPRGTGAAIGDPFSPQDEFIRLQKLGPVSDEEAYRTWNMGQCLMVITPEPETVQSLLSDFDLPSKLIGEVTREEGVICSSKGLEGEELNF